MGKSLVFVFLTHSVPACWGLKVKVNGQCKNVGTRRITTKILYMLRPTEIAVHLDFTQNVQ